MKNKEPKQKHETTLCLADEILCRRADFCSIWCSSYEFYIFLFLHSIIFVLTWQCGRAFNYRNKNGRRTKGKQTQKTTATRKKNIFHLYRESVPKNLSALQKQRIIVCFPRKTFSEPLTMSIGFIGAKHTIYDIYPIRKKKIFVLVDPECIFGCDFYSTVASIHYLTNKGACVIVASSFGETAGVKLGARYEEDALRTFAEEGGEGYTNWFAALPSIKKVEILRAVSSLNLDGDFSVAHKGKTKLFAGLTTTEKRNVLKLFFPLKEFTPCTTRPFLNILQKHMPDVKVSFSETVRIKKELAASEVIVLENLRFFKNERSTDPVERQTLADLLATGIDIYVNDSFATAHLVQASTVELPKRLQHGAAGQTLDKELAFYSRLLSHPARPFALVVGGINIPKKLRLIYSLVEKVERIFVGGRIAFPFLMARKLECGQSYLPQDELTVTVPILGKMEALRCSELAKKILEKCEKLNVNLAIPSDFLVAKDPDAPPSSAVQVDALSVPKDSYIMEVGDATVKVFARFLRSCRTIVWTGVLGWSFKGYSSKTADFISSIMNNEASIIVGGRCTARVVQEVVNFQNTIDNGLHISPGGVPCLEILEGNVLPGVEALSDVAGGIIASHSSVSADGLIRKLPLFIGCNSHHMKAIARKFVRRVHGKGDYIIHRGDKVVRLFVLAQGALIAKGGADYDSTPSRYITQGLTVGMHDFISQSPAEETVRVAESDTVTYQLSYSSLSELLNTYPDLSTQLLQNLSKQLRGIAIQDYKKQCSIMSITKRMACASRIPTPHVQITRNGMWEDILQDLVSTTVFQRLVMAYAPYTACADSTYELPGNLASSSLSRIFSPIYLYKGLPFSLACSVVKTMLYHHLIAVTRQPFVACVSSAVIVSPIRLLSYSIPYTDFNFNLLLEEGMYSAALSVAPIASYSLFLKGKQKLENYFRRRLNSVSQVGLIVLVKLCLGSLLFLIVYQRNFLYTPPSASQIWNTRAFRAYQTKQALSTILRILIHHLKHLFFS